MSIQGATRVYEYTGRYTAVYRALLQYTGRCFSIQGATAVYRALLQYTGRYCSYCIVYKYIGRCSSIQGATIVYRALQQYTGRHFSKQGATAVYSAYRSYCIVFEYTGRYCSVCLFFFHFFFHSVVCTTQILN